MVRHLASIAAFIVVTFAVQATSHFVVNAEHYAAVPHIRPEPIFVLGFATMIIQGAIMSVALSQWRAGDVRLRDGLAVSFGIGAFLVAYSALSEPAKYAVPSVSDWMLVEALAGFVQYGLFGLAPGLIHSRLTGADRTEPAHGL